MSIYERAAERLRQHTDHALITADDVVAVAAAVWDAIYACDQCHGTNVEEFIEPVSVPCHYEHVQLSNPHNGEVRWCRPDMAEWRCVRKPEYFTRCVGPNVSESGRQPHAECRRVPVPYEGNET